MTANSKVLALKARKAISNPRRLVKFLIPGILPSKLGQYANWSLRRFAAPSPDFVKRAVLIRNGQPNATWVETGTYLGHTTRQLAKNATMVYSIEPEPTLFAKAKKSFAGSRNVEILNGTSEDTLPTLLPRINGDVNFWLDGHYSCGKTYMGPLDTPILEELKCVSQHMSHFRKTTVLIDDLRLFNSQVHVYGAYPSVDVLVDWARTNDLRWHIEHDIFVARNY